MNKTLTILLILIVVFGIGYFAFKGDTEKQSIETSTFSDSVYGVEFDYPTGPEGYVLEEVMPVDLGSDFIKALILFRTEDANREMPEGGEGPPVIVVSVFGNPQNLSPLAWAEANMQYSSINLKMGDVSEAQVGGVNAIGYSADGLYASNNAVVANKGYIYIITGQFMDRDSDLYRDFEPILESVRFIETQG